MLNTTQTSATALTTSIQKDMVKASNKTKPKRLPPRLVEVSHCIDIHPQMRRVVLTGNSLLGFPANKNGSHIKLFFPRAHQTAPILPQMGAQGPIWPSDEQRPITRTYSVRYYNPGNNTLAIDFVRHTHAGPASQWAQNAQPGDKIGVSSPGGPDPLLAPAQCHILVGDMTALPAINAILETLPPTARGFAFIVGQQQQFNLTHNSNLQVVWLPQENSSANDGTPPLNAKTQAQQARLKIEPLLADLESTENHNHAPLSVFVAGENSLVLTLRDYFKARYALNKYLLYAVPYWRKGQHEEDYHQQRHTIMDEVF